jgi:FG-GAP-like repeat
MTVTHFPIPPLKDGVTIRGDRRGTRLGPELRVHEICEGCGGVFTVSNDPPTGNPVRITGLRIAGPSRGRYAKVLGQKGIITNDLRPVIIDRNDLSDWPNAAIAVTRPPGGGDECAIPVQASPWSNVRVLRNFIHHDEADDFGYGTVLDGTATIFGNTFLQNRHAISAAGNPSSGYAAYANLILSNVPTWYDNGFNPHGPQQDFDMHGFGPGVDSHRNGGYAGHRVDIAWNTFFGADRPNFELRGTPCTTPEEPDFFRNNVTTQDKDSTLKRRDGWEAYAYNFEGDTRVQSGTYSGTSQQILLDIADNKYGDSGSYDAPQPRDLRVGDFDGDGLDDLFLATQAAFYYSPGGAAEWRLLASGRTDRAEDLVFGDFDADGRTDIVGKNGAYLMVSWGGASDWEVLNFPPAAAIDPATSALAAGNFDGAGPDDLFFADGHNWYLSYGGSAAFVPVGPSSFRVQDVRFGDFNNNGTTDVFSVVGGQWSFSDGATVNWQPLQSALADTVEALYVADFNGDGQADVATSCDHGCWKISYRGAEPWHVVAHEYGLNQVTVAGIGHFLGLSDDDVLMFNLLHIVDPDVSERVLFIAAGGVAPFQRYSRQEMI